MSSWSPTTIGLGPAPGPTGMLWSQSTGSAMAEYPLQEDLDTLSSWPMARAGEWLGLACRMWWMGDSLIHRTQRRLYLSTGGWSGNEDIAGAMMGSFLWAIVWVSSRRGGHHVLDLTTFKWLSDA